MTYQELIETVSLIIENEKIKKRGLTLLFDLPIDELTNINKELFFKSHPYDTKFEPSEEFEVMLGGVLVKFKKSS